MNDYGVDTSVCSSCEGPMDREAMGLIVFCRACKLNLQKNMITQQKRSKLQELAQLEKLEKEIDESISSL